MRHTLQERYDVFLTHVTEYLLPHKMNPTLCSVLIKTLLYAAKIEAESLTAFNFLPMYDKNNSDSVCFIIRGIDEENSKLFVNYLKTLFPLGLIQPSQRDYRPNNAVFESKFSVTYYIRLTDKDIYRVLWSVFLNTFKNLPSKYYEYYQLETMLLSPADSRLFKSKVKTKATKLKKEINEELITQEKKQETENNLMSQPIQSFFNLL